LLSSPSIFLLGAAKSVGYAVLLETASALFSARSEFNYILVQMMEARVIYCERRSQRAPFYNLLIQRFCGYNSHHADIAEVLAIVMLAGRKP
jgi:hypothetical protein